MALFAGAFRVDYKYFDMKIEVFKEFEGGALRLFDAINPDRVTWLFGSENHRDGPNSAYKNSPYENDLAPIQPDLPGTIYFDSNACGDVRLGSTQKNVVLDYTKPIIQSYTGVFTSFKHYGHGSSGSRGQYNYETRDTWECELIVKDDSGIDNGAYKITANNEVVLAELSRKDPSLDYTMPGVYVRFEQSIVDSTMHRVTIVIDPDEIPEDKKEAVLKKCSEDDVMSYMTLELYFYDIAGNVGPEDPRFSRAFVLIDKLKSEMLEDVNRLKLDFVDTDPANLFIDKDTIGKTTISVYDPNKTLDEYGFKAKIGLLEGSVGYLSGDTEGPDEKVYTQHVDGIDSSGYVKAYAYLDGTLGQVSCLDPYYDVVMDMDLAIDIRSLTYVEGELGRFIVECDSNRRKLNVDPFIPSVLKNEEIYGLCKLLERELNTMYTPMSGDCRIGILEKIHRISQFKNPDECETELLPRFAEEHGSELAFTYEQVEKAAKVIQKYAQNKNLNTRDLVDSIYRRYFMILPYIDRWKGTKRSFELLYRVLGIDAEIEPLWEGPDGQMVHEDKAKPDYRLTAHLDLILNASTYSNKDIRELSDFAMVAVKSILPVNRVLSEVNIVDETEGGGEVNLSHIDLSREERGVQDEKIYFKYEWVKQSYRPDSMIKSCGELYLPLSMYPSETIVGHALDSTREWPIPENCGFYFSRYADMLKTYDSVPLKIAFLDGERQMVEVDLIASGIILEGDKVFVKCKNTETNAAQMTKFNNNILTTTGTIGYGFAFSRLVKNYCKPLSYTEFKSMDAAQTPYDLERQNG